MIGAADGIETLEAFALRYPMTGHFKFFTGPHGAKGRASVLVKITTSDGLVGWGQSVPIVTPARRLRCESRASKGEGSLSSMRKVRK